MEQEETERFAVILQLGLHIGIFCSFLVNTAVILHSFQKSRGPSQVELVMLWRYEHLLVPGQLHTSTLVPTLFMIK